MEGTPPGDALPPPPQQATPARKGARCGAGAGSQHPHRPHPGHTGRGTPAARPRGWAAGGGTAPDTRRPSQRWQATPPGDGPPPPPRHPAPTGHAGQGDSVVPPHPPARAHSTWVADPNSPPSGQAFGGDGAPDLRRPSKRWKASPRGTPFRHPHSKQRRPERAHAVGPVLGSNARTDRTRDTRVAEPRPPAPEDRRLWEGQRLTPDAPHNSGRPPPPGTAPHHPRGMQPPQGMRAKGTVPGPHNRPPAPTARGWRTPTARPVGGQSGEGERLTSDAPLQRWRATPPGDGSPPPRRHAAPTGHAGRGDSVGPPHPHTPAHSTWMTDPGSPPSGRAVGRGGAPGLRRPSQQWQATPPGDGPPPPPQYAAPTGHAGQGDITGPPLPHTRTHSTWVMDPDGPPGERATAGRGRAPDLRRQTPPATARGTPPGDALPPPPQRATLAHEGACCETGAGSPRPHQLHRGHTNCGTPAARPRGWAAEGRDSA